jgi:uroporphyrinogen decarboxylase
MTSLERWQAVLGRRRPDRVPMDYWATDEFTGRLLNHLGCSTKQAAFKKLRLDVPVKPKPVYIGPPLPPGMDEFGRKRAHIAYDTGSYEECVSHPLAGFASVSEIEQNFRFPQPDDWDYSTIADQVRGHEDEPVQAGGSEPFLIYKDLRGQEQAFVDLVENPEIVHYVLDKLFNLAYQDTLRMFERLPGRVTFSYVAEDLGGQTDLMMSPRHIRTYLLPGMKRMIDLIHQNGAYVFHHDDGNCRRILPDLIEAGIDLLNPIQWRCPGMVREELKRDFGGRLVFHGGMDNQVTLPFGTVDDVRREVRENLRILGAGGGFILAPCHNIQPLTPVENVVAMYETGFHEGGGSGRFMEDSER